MAGPYLPTTQLWDVSEIYSTPELSPGMQELFVRMYQNLNLMALTINGKDIGSYVQLEGVSGQTFFSNPSLSSVTSTQPTARQVYRKVINFGALPNAGINPLKSVPHGLTITPATTLTRLYGASTRPGVGFIPLPYSSSVAGDIIELSMDATNINITTSSNKSLYTVTYIIIEILKL
jgi:hypothetical protein